MRVYKEEQEMNKRIKEIPFVHASKLVAWGRRGGTASTHYSNIQAGCQHAAKNH